MTILRKLIEREESYAVHALIEICVILGAMRLSEMTSADSGDDLS